MLVRIFLCRNGEHSVGANSPQDKDTSVTGLPRDPPLSETGERQTFELAAKLRSLSSDLLVYSSPSYRALTTCSPLAEQISTEISAEPGLSDSYPETDRELPPRSAAALLPRLFPRTTVDVHYPLVQPPRNGESSNALHRRIEQLLALLIPRIDKASGPKPVDLVVVTHAPVVIALARVLSNDGGLDLQLGNAALTAFERPAEEGQKPLANWKMTLKADTSFLSSGDSNVWRHCTIPAPGGASPTQDQA